MTGTVLSRRETLQPRHIVEVSAAQQRHLTTGDQNDLTQKLSRIHLADAPQVTSPQLHKTARLDQFLLFLFAGFHAQRRRSNSDQASPATVRRAAQTSVQTRFVSVQISACVRCYMYFQNSSLSVLIFFYMLQFFTAKMFQKSIYTV